MDLLAADRGEEREFRVTFREPKLGLTVCNAQLGGDRAGRCTGPVLIAGVVGQVLRGGSAGAEPRGAGLPGATLRDKCFPREFVCVREYSSLSLSSSSF